MIPLLYKVGVGLGLINLHFPNLNLKHQVKSNLNLSLTFVDVKFVDIFDNRQLFMYFFDTITHLLCISLWENFSTCLSTVKWKEYENIDFSWKNIFRISGEVFLINCWRKLTISHYLKAPKNNFSNYGCILSWSNHILIKVNFFEDIFPAQYVVWYYIMSTKETVFSNESIDAKVNELYIQLEKGKYQCLKCGKTAPRRDNMVYHVENHIEGLSYPCQICGKVYRSRHSMLNHKYRHNA